MTASASGGTPGYSYSWAKISGTTFTISNSADAATKFAKYYTAGATESGVYRCTVTDSFGATGYADCSVSITANGVVTVSLSTSTLSAAIMPAGTATTGSVTATPSGGSGTGYSYSWTTTDTPPFTVTSPTSASTTFYKYFAAGVYGYQAVTYRCTVTDSLGGSGYAECVVDIRAYQAVAVYLHHSTVSGSAYVPGTATSSSVTATAYNGSGTGWSYAWTRVSGDTYTVSSPSSATTAFSKYYGSVGSGSAVYRCTATDSVGNTGYNDVTVNLGAGAALSASANVSSVAYVSYTGHSSHFYTDAVTVTASGGSGGYSYAWTKLSGSYTFGCDATNNVTRFNAWVPAGGVQQSVYRCTVTDSESNTATADVTVLLANTAISVSASPTSVSGTGPGYEADVDTGSTTVTASGGIGTYSYSWAYYSGSGPTPTIHGGSTATAYFTAPLGEETSYSFVYRCTVTDGYGSASGYVDVPVNFSN